MAARIALIALSFLWLSGCGGGGLNAEAASTGTGAGAGQLNLQITGTPPQQAVRSVIVIEGVEVESSTGAITRLPFDVPLPVDLAAIQGGQREPLLLAAPLPAGEFRRLTLRVDAQPEDSRSFVEFADGSRQPLVLPAGAELTLAVPFGVSGQAPSTFTLDIDLGAVSATSAGVGGIPLTPALRLLEDDRAAGLRGRVDMALLSSPECRNVLAGTDTAQILLFPGTPTLADVSRADVAPFTSIPVALDAGSGEFRFDDAFLPAQSFTLAVTCDALRSQIDTDELRVLGELTRVQLTAGTTLSQDLGPAFMGPDTRAGTMAAREDRGGSASGSGSGDF